VGILTKINFLLLTSVLALIATSILTRVFTSHELEYYTLVEDIKTLQSYATEALAYEKNFEKTFSDQELVYDALDKADIYLNNIHSDLLGENAPKIKEVSGLLGLFRDSFRKMVVNVTNLLSKKEQINTLADRYFAKNDEVSVQINEHISSGLLGFTDLDATLLQVLKNDSLTAFTSINRIVLSVNQDLILEGHITRFHNNYELAILDLEIWQKNISIHVLSLEETLYQELSQQLTRTYTEITSLVPELEKLYLENQQISRDLQNHKTEISRITKQITEQAEILRSQKHQNTTILQWLGQGSIILFLLIGGYLFALSITNPLLTLTKSTRAVSGGDYSQELGITRHDEIGQLAYNFNQMRENLKKSFELIDEQKEQYQSIFENAIEGIFQSSPDGRFLRVNQALIEILGYTSPEEMITCISNIREQLYVNPSDRDNFANLLETDGFVKGFETRLKRKDGSIISVLINAQTIYDEHRKSNVFQGMIEDISERKRIEEYRIAKEAAEKSNHAKSEFLANMSHELRSPLNAILGFTQVMTRSQTLPSEHRNNLDIIMRSGEHLLTLINQVLDLSKIEAGKITLNETEFDLYRLLNDLEHLFSLKGRKKHLTMLFERTNDVPRCIRTDEIKLRQVLINLLNNAIKFTEQGSVALRVANCKLRNEHTPLPYREGKSEIRNLKFEIEDTGPGIAPEEIDKIFKVFEQTEIGRQTLESTGLGLPISRKFVQLMGSEMHIESEFGRGAIFSFDIQVRVAVSPDMASETRARRVVALKPGQLPYRMLIVDDQPYNRQLLVKLLNPFGFVLREAANGQEAIEIWENWEPHLIWMDMRMPVMDGYEAVKKIREIESSYPGVTGSRTVIIAQTASSFEEDRDMVLSSGCDDFLRKPYKDTEIFSMIDKHLGVRFVYEEYEGEALRYEAPAPESLAGLPQNLMTDLKQGAEDVDIDLLFSVIERIRERDVTLADNLAQLAEDFDYDGILALITKKS